MKIEIEDNFPLSKTRSVKGSRRLAREKVLQILNAFEVSETPWPQLFPHIFGRRFNFDDENRANSKSKKILTHDEVYELDADIPIIWTEDDVKFATTLLETAIENEKFFDSVIEVNATNWGLERIATIDRLLIYIAVSELMHLPDMPARVSINEAIDIAKKYSTDKSGVFINGMLEAFINVLKEKNLFGKKGLGLQKKNDRFVYSDLVE